MKFLLALYDPGAPPRAGSHWSWHAPELSAALLDRFFYDIANKHRPEHPNSLAPDHVWGGVARVNAEFMAAYRFVNGGRDGQGRPGRYVLIAAFAAATDAVGKDLTPLLQSHAFERVVSEAMSRCAGEFGFRIAKKTLTGGACRPCRTTPCSAWALRQPARRPRPSGRHLLAFVGASVSSMNGHKSAEDRSGMPAACALVSSVPR